MAWTDPVDLYCERLTPAFWAEPINALSNLAFIVAGLLALREARRLGRRDPLIIGLCLLAVLIGMGSFLFHTIAQRWAGLADVIPIAVFILVYLYAAIDRYLGLGPILALPTTAAVFAVSLLAREAVVWMAGGSLNGSESYAPALALLACASLVLAAMRHRAAWATGVATVVFAISLTARTLDSRICDVFPMGTHVFWHLLNGTMLGILLFALIHHGRAARP